MIVITTPTGQIGSKVLSTLLKSAEQIRVITRDPSKLSVEIQNRVGVLKGSHSEPDVVDRAFEGADSVFWLVASDAHAISVEASYVDFSRPACEALRRHKVKRVVGISALGRGWTKNAGHVTATLALDDMLAKTGVHYRALCCGSLMENTLRQSRFLQDQGVFYSVAPGDLKGSAVATRDVAKVAADLLLTQNWTGVDEVPLKGPEDISNNEMAKIISDVLQRPVRYQEMKMTDFHAMLLKRGDSEGMAQAMINMAIAKNEGIDDVVRRTAPNLTPTTFRQWCEEVLKPVILKN